MALLKFSALIEKISGKLGGSVFGTSKSGSYVKQNSYSQQPNTPLQSIQRNKISLVPQLWRTLASSQRLDWENATANFPYTNRLGQQAFYTGYQLFLWINNSQSQISLPVQLNAPVSVPVSEVVFSVQFVSPSFLFFSYSNVQPTDTLVIYATKSRPSGLGYCNSTLRVIMILNNTGFSSSFGITSQYVDVFGAFDLNSSIYFVVKVVSRSSFIPSSPTEASRVLDV